VKRDIDDRTKQVRAYYEKTAPSYETWVAVFERAMLGDGRRWVCGQAHGNVLEIGVGSGRNLPFYPAGARLIGIDLSPAMLEIARGRAAQLGLVADLSLGDAQGLPFADSAFDSVVCTLSLCAIPDERRAIAEVHRVLRPGGKFLVLEHVRSPIGIVRMGQRLLDPLMTRMACDSLLRDPLDHLGEAGFQVERCERTKFGIVERLVARKPMGDRRP
jgi:ubiquinone/menaquinone biosynthesis C-methylase UbiE